MTRNECGLESAIVGAVASEGISENARQHLIGCETCRDAVAADAWMKEFASLPQPEPALPDPALIWLKAEFMRERVTLSQLTQSISWWQTFGFAAIASGWALLLTWKWSTIESIVAAIDSGVMLWSLLNDSIVSTPFLLTLVMLTCATIAMAFQSVLIEE